MTPDPSTVGTFCPVGYSCSRIIPVADLLLFFGGIALIFVVSAAVLIFLVGRR